MRYLVRFLKIAVVVLVVAVVAVGGLLAWVTMRAWPQTSGEIAVPGVGAPVTVVRDAAGIPHITADSPHDLFLAQGYVHAQERMWQMEVWRHISAGRLAEMFGESQVDTDRFIRTVGWWQAAERDLATADPSTVATLEAYTAGVNAWLDAHRGSLGLPFLVAGIDPAPWTNLDTMAWVKVQAWDLGSNMDTEIFRYLADARLGDPARTDELFPPYREDAPIITPSGLPGSGGAGASRRPPVAAARDGARLATSTPATPTADHGGAWLDLTTRVRDALRLAGPIAGGTQIGDRGVGSNEWVVGPSRSLSGGALLANDTHLGPSMPSIFFINGLHCRTVGPACPYDVAGVSFPGAPGVVLGHNARIGWGATNLYVDVQDLVIETIDPADPGAYRFEGTSRPLTIRHESIAVKGGATVEIDVRETHHGPILNDADDRLRDAPPMALRWTALQGPDHTLDAILGLSTAATFDDFRAALSRYGAPAQNFIYADVDGHIGYQFPGHMPIRSDPTDTGLRPVDGADGRHEWTSMIPFESLPWQLDPEPAAIIAANNAPVDASYPYRLGLEWDPGYRAERIEELLTEYAQDGAIVPEMGEIQMDGAPLRARDALFVLGDLTDLELGGTPPATDDGRLILERISDWDGACDVDNLGCAAYMTWEYRVLRGLFDDELGPLARDYVGSSESWVVLGDLLEEPASSWWDDTTTTDLVESGETIVARAMDGAGAELRAALGTPDEWTWGRLHTVAFEEQTLGQSGIAPLEWYVNAAPRPVAGTGGTPLATAYDLGRAYPDPDDPEVVPVGVDELFEVSNLPVYRLVVDMGDLDGARIIITTGQSGNPFDPHATDMIEPWATGGSVPLPFSAAAIAAAAHDTLTLTP